MRRTCGGQVDQLFDLLDDNGSGTLELVELKPGLNMLQESRRPDSPRSKRAHLGWVAQWGARAVRLDKRIPLAVRPSNGEVDENSLGRAVWRREASTSAVLINAASTKDSAFSC